MRVSSLFLGLVGTATLPIAGLTAPAVAQSSSGKISEIIVYGTDPCPRSTDDSVVVCARKPETERYRIPERLRNGGSVQSRQAWAVRAKSFETVGKSGINSCSPVGPGGSSGCLQRIINEVRDENADQTVQDSAPPQ
jgi:hypothetical protein